VSAPRKGRQVAPKAKARKMVECRARKPYALPQLLDSSTALSAANLEMYCRSAIRAAWEAGERGAMKAAREEIARCRLTPASIAAMARSLADYNDHRKWPEGEEATRKIDWLSIGAGCVERFGTARDAHLAAWPALHAALSIIVDVPLEHGQDADALLLTLLHTGWRHVPRHQQARVAQRMARFVGDSLTGRPFVPTGGAR
jgi:hypothetical protein